MIVVFILVVAVLLFIVHRENQISNRTIKEIERISAETDRIYERIQRLHGR